MGPHRQNFYQMNTDIKESDLALQMGIDRDILKRMRRPGADLQPDADWYEAKGTGIMITPSGREKIERALPAAKKEGAPPEEKTRDITILRLCPNQRVVFGEPREGDPDQITVRLARGPSPLYRPGMVLPGCLPLPHDGQWQYIGPKPRTRDSL